MPITYNAGTNEITITGASELTPYDFEDIYQADIAGVWGVVSKQGNKQYYFNCTLEVGIGGGAAGYLADTLKEISFAPGEEFNIRDSGYFKSGTVISEPNKATKDGCILIMEMTSLNNYVRCYGEWLFYSSQLINIDPTWGQFLLGPEDIVYRIHLWNSKIGGFAYTREIGDWGDMYNWYRCNIENAEFGINCTSGQFPDNHFTDTAMIGTEKGVRITYLGYYSEDSMDIRNLWISNATSEDFEYFNCGVNYPWSSHLINANCNWVFDWGGSTGQNEYGAVFRQYTFNLHIVDEYGADIDNARVRVWDKDDNLLFTVYTTAGYITEQIISYGYYTPPTGNITLYSPHTLTVDKVGYNDMDTIWNIDESVDWILTLTDPCFPWTIAEINAAAASGYDHSDVANYPMSWNGTFLTIWGDSGGSSPMGYDTDHPITMEEVWAFCAYTKGTCICTKDSDDTFTMKEIFIIGDAVNPTYFTSENQSIWQYDYFSVTNNAVMRLGSIATDVSNPYATPKWGATWTIDRKTLPHIHPPMTSTCFFVRNGGELYLYDSRIALTNNSKAFDTEIGAYTYVGYSAFAGYDRLDATFVRWWGTLEFDHLHLHHCRNMNFPTPPQAGSAHLHIYSNRNDLQVRDTESWVYDAILSYAIICACKTLQNGKVNLVDPEGLDYNKICVQNSVNNFQKLWHRFAIKVKDKNDNAIVGAKVRILNNLSLEVYNEDSLGDGWTPMQLIKEWQTNAVGEPIIYPTQFILEGPFTLIIAKEGHEKYVTSLEMNKRMDTEEIRLKRIRINIDNEVIE